jgi:hypothetical protein
VLGAVTGTGTTGAGAGGAGNLVITAGGTDYTIAVANNDTAATIRDAINNTTGLGSTGAVTASIDGSNHLVLTASNADVDFSVNASSTDATTTALGITEGTAHNSTSLLDRIVAAGGSNGGSTLAIGVNGGATSTITFGTGAGQVSTFAELNTALGNISGLTGSVSGTTALLSVASSSTQNSLSLTGSTGISTALGISNGTLNGTAVTTSNTDATRASLQTQYNDILTQIDQLASDSSYNGINLLKGDNLKVTFNEKGTSSLTISGVTFDSAGLGLTAASGNAFQSNATVDATLSTIDTSLTTLRTQASKFGSNLTTVQTRNDFTKNLVNTLQSGSDALTLADSNEEAANVLALQTRQSLSISALSLANQSNQSVLQLLR